MGSYLTRAFCALLLAVALAPVTSWASTEDELRQIEEQRRAAIQAKDVGTLNRIYAPSFVAIAVNGQLINRAQLFRVFMQADPSLSFKTDEIKVVDHGDTAVFFGRLTASNPAGKIVFATRFSHVFVREGGTWVCIAGQSTPMQVPAGS